MTETFNILITDGVDIRCAEMLTAEGFSVQYDNHLSYAEISHALLSSDALIVRSRTNVDAGLLNSGHRLKIVGRAGAGVDNIDVDAATRRGIIVMNTPGGNTIATAEHTISMILALARNIPQAHQSLKAGEWERARFTGIELQSKVIGIIGFGKVGSEVAKRCIGFGMSVLTYDPAHSSEIVAKQGVELVTLTELLRQSDIISIHTPLLEQTRGLLCEETFRKCKDGVRIINCARGGIVDEGALLDALESGKVAGAALDVFEHEPPPRTSPLIQHPNVIVTPHLGASTEEAQEKVAIQIAQQVAQALRGRSVTGSVNADLIRVAMTKEFQPYLRLAESLGRFISQIKNGAFKSISVIQTTDVPGELLPALGAAVVKGVFDRVLSEPINYLNAPLVARDRGIIIEFRHRSVEEQFTRLIEIEYSTEKEQHVVAGTVLGDKDIWITRIDRFHVEIRPEGHLLIYKNPDQPGMLAQVSHLLAEAEINIAGLSLGRYGKGEDALTIISVDSPIDERTIARLIAIKGVTDLKIVSL